MILCRALSPQAAWLSLIYIIQSSTIHSTPFNFHLRQQKPLLLDSFNRSNTSTQITTTHLPTLLSYHITNPLQPSAESATMILTLLLTLLIIIFVLSRSSNPRTLAMQKADALLAQTSRASVARDSIEIDTKKRAEWMRIGVQKDSREGQVCCSCFSFQVMLLFVVCIYVVADAYILVCRRPVRRLRSRLKQ